MKRFIIHANQSVIVKSTRGLWPNETLRSKPTFAIDSETFDDAMLSAYGSVRNRYARDGVEILDINITAELVREIPTRKIRGAEAAKGGQLG